MHAISFNFRGLLMGKGWDTECNLISRDTFNGSGIVQILSPFTSVSACVHIYVSYASFVSVMLFGSIVKQC